MGLFSKTESNVPWKTLNSVDQIDTLLEASHQKPVAIFKHSTTCGISAGAKYKLDQEWDIDAEKVDIYYLDLLRYRSVSNAVADKTGVWHQSPQVILLKDGKAVFDTSHMAISAGRLAQALEA
ncbi:MAG: bacillithiol system redox-active protein YtxJ [Bacteroidota bacterium]